jgi:hypothetical protein
MPSSVQPAHAPQKPVICWWESLVAGMVWIKAWLGIASSLAGSSISRLGFVHDRGVTDKEASQTRPSVAVALSGQAQKNARLAQILRSRKKRALSG